MLEKLKALLKKFGIEIAADKEAEFKTEIEKLEKDSAGNVDFSKIDFSKFTDKENPVLKAIVDQLNIVQQQNKNLLDALAKERTDRENAIKASETQQKADREKKVADKIADALKNKKITEAEKDLWKGRLDKDFDEWGKELDAKATPKQFEKKDTSTDPSLRSGQGSASGEEKKGAFATLRDEIKTQMDVGGTKV